MKTFKLLGFAGMASFAMAITVNTPAHAEAQGLDGAVAEKPSNFVHRVSHNLAAAEQYTGNVASGYKWGQQGSVTEKPNSAWSNAEGANDRVGYKWGQNTVTEQTGTRWGRRNDSEQAGTRWGRRNDVEQSGTRWGRR